MKTSKPVRDAAFQILNRDRVVENGRRSNATVVENLNKLGFASLGDNVSGCATWLQYQLLNSVDEKGVPHAVLTDANFCRVRGCRVCDRRRQQKWRARLHHAAATIGHPERWIGFTTLTVKNPLPADLPQTLDRLNSGWVNLKKQQWWKKTILGCVKTIEVTWGCDDRPHPHLHILQWQHPDALGNRRVLIEQIRDSWKSALGVDYAPIIHRTRIYSPCGGSSSAIREAVKYTSKSGYQFTEFDRFACVWIALRGRRTITTTGIVKQTLARQQIGDENDLLKISPWERDRGEPLGVSLTFRWDDRLDGYTIYGVG